MLLLGVSPMMSSQDDRRPRHSHSGQESHSGGHAHHSPQPAGDSGGDRPGMGMPPAMEHGGAIWPHYANMILGLWLITNVYSMRYDSPQLQVSDGVSGLLVIVLAALSLSPRGAIRLAAPWLNCLVGTWLLFAPLIFWAPTPGIYNSDTLMGVLVISFAILAPGMPGMRMVMGPDIPDGWSYNPSSWPQRAPVIALALVGFFLSRQMTAYQLGHTASFLDPVFGTGTQQVLTSDVSRAFPIADAGLGAVAYAIEFLMGFMGDRARWRTMPWMVMFFGILVVPLGIVSVTLIILQPLAVGAWCTPCLIAAASMLVMMSLTLDEVVAMLQFLVQARREGQSAWRVFWLGGALRRPPTPADTRPDTVSLTAMLWGVGLPWNLVATLALGVWLAAAPTVLGSSGDAASSDRLVGALIVTVVMIALADVGRPARYLSILLGAWVLGTPWLLDGATGATIWNNIVVGTLVMLLSLQRGRVGETYGDYQRFIR